MKIILVTLGKSNPDRMNGINKMVYQLACDLTARNLNMEVWGITSQIDQHEKRPYELRLFKGNHKSFILPDSLKKQISLLEKETIIHFHGVMTPLFYSMAKTLRKRNIRYVITPHGAFQEKSLKRNRITKSIYINLFEKTFLNAAYSIQAITPYEIKSIRLVTDTKIIHIPNAYDGAGITPADAQPKELIFGFIGRLDSDHKGIDILIDSFANYYHQGGKGKLWIIGEGNDKRRLQQQSKALPISFLGELHGKQKADIISQISLFCYPSRWDVLPTSALETCLYGKPLIASRETGLEEAVTKCKAGFVLEENTVPHMEKALEKSEKCHDLSLLAHIGDNARRMVTGQFSWHKVTPAIVKNLYGINL